MPTCEICQYRKTKFFHKIDKYIYYQCPRCITLFFSPRPTLKQITVYYKKKFKYLAAEANEKLIRRRAKSILNNLIKMSPGGKTLLDIGSGYGYFLNEANKFGLKTVGIEPSTNLSHISLYRYNDIVFNLTLEEYIKNRKEKRFDFITMIHTIEHVLNPEDTVKKAIQLLNHNGVLYIETPNLNSHLFKIEKYNYTFLTPPDHIWIFSQKSFKYILSKIPEIKIEKISTYSYPEHFMGIIKNQINRKRSEKIRRNQKSENSDKSDTSDLSGLSGIRSLPILRSILNSSEKTSKSLKYLILDRLLAPLFTPLLNLGNKGSILELYIRKK